MARQPDIQYVNIYSYGNTARKLEPIKKKNKVTLPQPKTRRAKRKVIYVDPLSVCATAVAGLLLIAMMVGLIRMGITNSRNAELEARAAQLRSQNVQVQEDFHAAYDLQAVEEKALQMGLVPQDELRQENLQLMVPAHQAAPGLWERIGQFFTELFAG